MSKEEIKEEMKQDSPAEVKGAIRRRQMEAARARMMDDVPQADVVVTNPTHFAVALKYDGTRPAPEFVAKGQDLIALQIRRSPRSTACRSSTTAARPLAARGGRDRPDLPEEFFQAVAQLLAFVYRVARRRIAMSAIADETDRRERRHAHEADGAHRPARRGRRRPDRRRC